MTPLHRAVIEDDIRSLADPSFIEKWIGVSDQLGFTALEIAKFLGKYDAVKLLDGEFSLIFKLQPNGMKQPVVLSLEGFEKSLNIRYRSYLTFSSYSSLKEMVDNCPYILRSRAVASDNYEWTETYQEELLFGKMAPLYIKWIDPILGYGVFAEEQISSGTFIGEYTGMVRCLSRGHSDHNAYCLHYPTKFWSLKYCVVDSSKEGNLMRFINHSDHPNLHPICLIDRGLLHQVFIASRQIKKGDQLTFNYGKDFWMKRKSVTN